MSRYGWLRELSHSPGGAVGHWRDGRVRRREEERCSAVLVGASGAFLRGRLAEHVEGRAGRVPVWTWTNLLAHGTQEDLSEERVAMRERGATVNEEWREARSYLAAEVLELAGTFGPLGEVQRVVLVPLELELAARPDVAGWDQRQWVGSVKAALARYRRERRRAGIRAERRI